MAEGPYRRTRLVAYHGVNDAVPSFRRGERSIGNFLHAVPVISESIAIGAERDRMALRAPREWVHGTR